MIQARPSSPSTASASPRVRYRFDAPEALLAEHGTLAVFRYGDADGKPADADPRLLDLALPCLDPTPALEHWHVDAPVEHGCDGGVAFARGGGWLFASIEVAEADHHDHIGEAAEHAYRSFCDFLARQPEGAHVQRLWNYLDRINEGDGDAERYKYFCDGRVRGMGDFFAGGFPAATAIGLPGDTGRLALYCLATTHAGTRIENPRQMSAWRYPRQYGRTPPSFARAMRLPAADVLAISGTAAITGHESRHHDDLEAQLEEIRTNISALLDTAGMPPGLDAGAPMKIYLRHAQDATRVNAFFDRQLPDAPRLLLKGDVCRHELLVEIDGWRYA